MGIFNDDNSCMDQCEIIAALSALSLAIAKGKSAEEIELLAIYFEQIRITLVTIGAVVAKCELENENVAETKNAFSEAADAEGD